MAVKSFTTRLIKRTELTPKVLKMEFTSPIGGLDYKPGQFASILVAKNTRRSYSFASLPGRQFDLLVDVAPNGPGSIFLANLKEGEEMTCLAPLGNFLYHNGSERQVYFYATGTGLAPLWVMLLNELEVQDTKRKIKLWLGFRYEEEIFYQSELERLANRHPNFSYELFLSRPTGSWRGRNGYMNQDIPAKLDEDIDAYICGGHNMIADTKARLLAAGVPLAQIFTEQYYQIDEAD